MELPRALRRLLLLLPLGALLAARTHAQIVEANAGVGGGSVYMASGSANGETYRGQWVVRNLMCYISKSMVNGVEHTEKKCKNVNSDTYHDMTSEEEAIINNQIKIQEEQKRLMQEKIEKNNAIMENTMRSMHQHMQNTIERSMQRMQEQMRRVFG